MVALAREHELVLHAHSDVDAIERLFKSWPQARILWAHSGFERPDAVREMLRKHRNLWCDLAFRTDQAAEARSSMPAWRAAFTEFPDRFMVGTDTFTPERWHYIVRACRLVARLAGRPAAAVAERIAWRNAEAPAARRLAEEGVSRAALLALALMRRCPRARATTTAARR